MSRLSGKQKQEGRLLGMVQSSEHTNPAHSEREEAETSEKATNEKVLVVMATR